MKWYKRSKWKLEYQGFTYEYDTARQLGQMVRESGSKMPNLYDPDCTDHEDYNEGVRN